MPTCLSSHQTDNPQDATAERTKLCLPLSSLSSRDTFFKPQQLCSEVYIFVEFRLTEVGLVEFRLVEFRLTEVGLVEFKDTEVPLVEFGLVMLGLNEFGFVDFFTC